VPNTASAEGSTYPARRAGKNLNTKAQLSTENHPHDQIETIHKTKKFAKSQKSNEDQN